MIVQDYINFQKTYQDKYGDDTVVFMMVGSFYEIYGIEGIGKCHQLAQLLNLVVTRKDKSKTDPPNFSNPLMVGIPVGAFKKYIKVLMDNKYTVVVIDQKPNDTTSRALRRIYSHGTYTEEFTDSNSNHIGVIFCDYTDSVYFGAAFADLSTGDCSVREIITGNKTLRFEELYRVVEYINPSETICLFANHMTDDQCKEIKNLFSSRSVSFSLLEQHFVKIDYQNAVIQKVFPCHSILSPIECLDLELVNFARIAFVSLLQYCYEHNHACSGGLGKPTVIHDSNKLVLHNNSIYQLAIYLTSKDKSLFDVVNKTSTPMGKRLLRQQLLNPSCVKTEIEQYFDDTEDILLKLDFFDKHLQEIVDVERLHKKIEQQLCSPHELYSLMNSYVHIINIFDKQDEPLLPSLESWYQTVSQQINLNKCSILMNDICGSLLYEEFASSEMKQLMKTSIDCKTKIDKICKKLSSCISKCDVKLEKHLKTGYFIWTTKTRASLIKEQFGTQFTFKNDKQRCLISNDALNTLFHKLLKCEDKMKPLAKDEYLAKISSIYNDFADILKSSASKVAYYDTITSRAKCVHDNRYSRPTIIDSNEGSIHAEQLRHAIIDTFDDTMFIPNDICLDFNHSGLLLYGVNGSGKSCYSKSVGLAIVLAQSGHYVPAKSCVISPFTRLYTRISDADNIYKGQSSFFVEMSELKSIIHYADEKSIILGDEVCKGTEDVSGVAIVASSVKWLLDKKSKFIFATHLHKLQSMSCIENHKKLQVKHMEVICDSKNNVITFKRSMKDGIGDTMYGVEIANYIIDEKKFGKMTVKFRNEVVKKSKTLVSNKKSRYNQKVIVDECQIPGCGVRDGLESHHIIFQSSEEAKNINVHNANNLVVLCKKHHDAIHSGKLTVNGWTSTTKGKVLDYS